MGIYASGEVVCRKCIEENVDVRDLVKYLDEYVDSLAEHIRTSPAEYARRLAICAECEKRAGINCTLCGCYIQARAAKRKMECPYDRGGPKWRAEE
jgi:hypothetical protein